MMQHGEFASDYVELRRNFYDIQTADNAMIITAGDRHGVPDVDVAPKNVDDNEKNSEVVADK